MFLTHVFSRVRINRNIGIPGSGLAGLLYVHTKLEELEYPVLEFLYLKIKFVELSGFNVKISVLF